ncbi:hypothetical protein FSP39_003775 [Pinctada imbricata]|uniref:5'-nucleotidase domain-containing protein 1 n=1 Tax=Pinctada imbricata TaxID=66713 RepID=A0AA89BVY5_PINIB|nr:hypothetical protein FSP39_003775 [Pinctada imbricata]
MTFCLRDYDAYGFDLDNTLAKYKLKDLMRLAYEALCDCLVTDHGYDPKIKDDIDRHKDFVCKGLFLDNEKGNFLKLSHDGKILRASHGTTMLSEGEIKAEYGLDSHWEHFTEAKANVKVNGRDMKFRFFENYFDIPSLVLCAHIVDYLDEKNGKSSERYTFWEDVYRSFGTNYIPTQFAKDGGKFFPNFKKNPSQYVQECSAGVKQWLKDLKQDNKVVFLMTSSAADFASLVLNTILGSDWKQYFDIYLTNARKPNFFINNNSFYTIGEDLSEKDAVTEIHLHTMYGQGNQHVLEEFIKKQTGVEKPKIVYFGDSLCSDSFPASHYAGWDVVLVLEEMEAEGYHPTVKDLTTEENSDEPRRKLPRKNVNLYIDPEEEEYILSKAWGSFFYHEEEDVKHDKHMNTFWGRIVSQYNAIAVPLIEYIAGMPIDHKYSRFTTDVGNTDGFSPAKPKPLLPKLSL